MMLQQTQVDRVIPKYRAFIKKYPTARKLASAKLLEVLKLWSGLGYNRRAKYLWEAAKLWRSGPLEDLPGVGPYTANAVRVFAHNEPRILLETNIRTVYLHHLFPNAQNVPDAQLLSYMITLKQQPDSRTWNWALMDYGSYLKKKYPNPSRRSKHHTAQKKFKDSDREIRGAILRAHVNGVRVKGYDPTRVRKLKRKLKLEGLI